MAQELILSACSASSSTKNTATPAIQLHDLDTYAHVHSFKSSSSSRNCLSYAPSSGGVGGTVWSVQDGKAIAGIWAWQKVRAGRGCKLTEGPAALEIASSRTSGMPDNLAESRMGSCWIAQWADISLGGGPRLDEN